MEQVTTQQRWADFPDSLVRFRERQVQLIATLRAQHLESLRAEYCSGDSAPKTVGAEAEKYLENLCNAEDFGFGWWLDHLLWWRPLAEALKIRAADSEALSSQGFCFDHCSICMGPSQVTKSRYGVICGPLRAGTFSITAVWHDYLRQSNADGKLEVVRAGSSQLFEGNAEDTANYLVQMAESWKVSGPPLP